MPFRQINDRDNDDVSTGGECDHVARFHHGTRFFHTMTVEANLA